MYSRNKSVINLQNLNSAERPLLADTEPDTDNTASAPSMSSNQSTVLDLSGLTSNWQSTVNSSLTYRMGNSKIRLQKPCMLAVLVLAGVLLLVYFTFSGYALRSNSRYSNHFVDQFSRPPETASPKDAPHLDMTIMRYNSTYPLTAPVKTAKGLMYKIAVIADPDTDSKVPDKNNVWRSFILKGSLYWDESAHKVDLVWESENTEIRSTLSQGGRGMELSELVVFNGALFTVDDRTGVVYRIEGNKVVPWVILPDGNGNEVQGFKCEWATVKDNSLYVGGLGKEWTTPDGNVLNFNPMFVKKISAAGHVEHIDWHDHYVHLRSAAGIEFPGYMIHEAVVWSDEHKKWFFLPRKASKSKYNDVDDERHGTNLLLTANEDLDPASIKVSHIGELGEPASHGFSSFKFIPGTSDRVIVALKSEELEGKIATYIIIFNVDGTIYYPETKIGDLKFEGIEFV